MKTNSEQLTRVADPSESVLIHLARAALADAGATDVSWPGLDLDDPAQRAFGDYELLEEIGRGGMGVVYRARQHSLDREVAIKFIASGLADSFSVARFLGEARAAARLMHPNIVPVHEVGSIGEVHYFSMPLVKGVSLATLLDQGPLPLAAVITLMLKLCEAIDYAHRLGLLHLDLKPANVLLDSRNEPLIADFGLARHMDAGGGVDAQEVSGTPAFMAPEQILIKQYRLTPGTDIYALGAILYRCLTGASAHGEGDADELIRRAAAGRIRNPRELQPGISRDLAAICMKCLELQPADRYASAATLAEDLRHVRDGLPVSVRSIGWAERAQRWFKREPRLAAALAIAASALVFGVAATTWQWREANTAKLQALTQRDAAEKAERMATLERDRTKISSEIGAFLFTHSEDAKTDDDLAKQLLQWLRVRLPGDEPGQADALAAFADGVSTMGRTALEGLLYTMIEVLGADYRKQVTAALENSSDKNRHIYRAMLAWRNEQKLAEPVVLKAALAAAMALNPDDPMTLQIATIYCPEPQGKPLCLYPDAAQRLTVIAPDNMFHWLLLLNTSSALNSKIAMHEAAARTRFDDYLGANYVAYAKAIELSGVKVSELLERPARILAPNETPEAVVASLEAWGVPMIGWRRLIDYCNPAKGEITTDSERADCLTVGTTMARANVSILSRMIGSVVVRRLAKGTALADEMKELRRRYKYLMFQSDELTHAQMLSYPMAKITADILSFGELEAFARRIEHFGIPSQPPADWQPEDPNDLLLPEERTDR